MNKMLVIVAVFKSALTLIAFIYSFSGISTALLGVYFPNIGETTDCMLSFLVKDILIE